MVSLNLRLLPKLIKRGILGGSSKNQYLTGDVRKIDMQLLFPKEHWKVTEHDDFFSADLLNYTFVAGKLKADVLTPKQTLEAQEANYGKAKDRLKEAKSTFKKASPMYKAAAQLRLTEAERNEKAQKLNLKKIKNLLEKTQKKKQVDENG